MLKNITMLKNMWNGNDDFKHCLWNAELDLIYAKDQKDSLCFVLQIKFGKKKGDSKTQSKLKKQVCPFFYLQETCCLIKKSAKKSYHSKHAFWSICDFKKAVLLQKCVDLKKVVFTMVLIQGAVGLLEFRTGIKNGLWIAGSHELFQVI